MSETALTPSEEKTKDKCYKGYMYILKNLAFSSNVFSIDDGIVVYFMDKSTDPMDIINKMTNYYSTPTEVIYISEKTCDIVRVDHVLFKVLQPYQLEQDGYYYKCSKKKLIDTIKLAVTEMNKHHVSIGCNCIDNTVEPNYKKDTV